MVSLVEADSKRKERLDGELVRSQRGYVYRLVLTHLSATFKYMADGVRNSDEIDAQSGTRFGG